MNSEKLKQRISEVLSVPLETVQDQALLQELVVDSFVLIEMVIDLQNTFQVRLDQEDLIDVRTVGDLIGLVLRKRK
jgi:acyl carrier protein